MVEHVSIPDGEIHEPKGITTAFAGQAYIANGSNSGSWENVVPSLAGAIFIETAADFPTPIGGVSTLLPQAYVVSSGLVIDLDFTLKFASNKTSLIGLDSETAVLNFTSAGLTAAITNDVGISVEMRHLCLISDFAPLFDLQGGGVAMLGLSDSCIGNITTQPHGTIDSFSTVNITRVTNDLLSAGALSFTGSTGAVDVNRATSSSDGAVWLDFSDVSFNGVAITLEKCAHGLLAGTRKFADIDPTKVFGGSIADCFFIGSTEPVGNVDGNTANFNVTSTLGVSDTKKSAINNLIPPEVVTITTINTPVVIGGSWTLTQASQFTQIAGTNGLEFTGGNANGDETFLVSVHITATKPGGGGAKLYMFRILKNGLPLVGGEGIADISDRGGSIFLRAFDLCDTGDEYTVDVQNTEATDNLTITTADIAILRTD